VTDDIAFQHEVDSRGLMCPEPVMMLHMQIRRMAASEVVRVLATDPSTRRDIPKFCQHLGHTLLAESASEGEFRFWVRKKG
jgi:tRNA 2-thiouridine synthesizing protein A